jgi:nucleoside-diphosphate-sugar epimerase
VAGAGRALVTGASGFLGSAVVRELVAQGLGVDGLVRSDDGSSLVAASGARPVRGDLLARATLEAALQGVDLVIHCAGAVGADLRHADAHEVNVRGTRQLLHAMRDHGTSRLVHVSTLRVLGRQTAAGAREDAPLGAPGDVYGTTKLDAEELVREARASGLRATIVRPGHMCGPGDRHLVPPLRAALEGGHFRYVEDGSNRIDALHVEDAARAIIATAALQHLDLVHIASLTPVTARELIETICRCASIAPPTRSVSAAVGRRLAAAWGAPAAHPVALEVMTADRRLDLSRLREEVGFFQRRTLEEAVRGSLEARS